MANAIGPYGFRPVRQLNGAAWTGATNLYYIPSTDNTVLSIGDAVISLAGGDANGVPGIAKAAGTTNPIRGVITGFVVAPNLASLVGTGLDLSLQNLPATKAKAYYAMVCDDLANTVFAIQGDGLTAANAVAAACNKNANFTVANPTAPAQMSASVLTESTIAATQVAYLLHIMGLEQKPNNAYGANANWLVKFNLQELAVGSAGI